MHEPRPDAYRATGEFAALAAEAYLSGWALAGVPLTGRVTAGCTAAVATALEFADDPGILEAALDLGHLEGIWATVYARRERLLRKHLKLVMAAWDDAVKPLDSRKLARRFRQDAYLASEAADPQKQWWKDTATAAALGWLRALYRSDGYAALVAAIGDAIRAGMAEGEAGALALAASRQGKTGSGIAAAFKAAYARLEDDPGIPGRAQDTVTAVIDGAGAGLGRVLASLAGDGATEEDMAAAVDDAVSGDDVRPVKTWLGDAIWAGIGAAVTSLYALAGVQVEWITDGNPCQACIDAERGSPYAPGDVPAYPQHPGCKCSLDTSSRLPLSFLAVFLN